MTSRRQADDDKHGIFVENAALEEQEGKIILRGTVTPASLHALKADTYQREYLGRGFNGNRKSSTLRSAIETGEHLPDVELGMRGGDFSERVSKNGDFIVLRDDVYIIDGLQRISTMLDWISDNPGVTPKTTIGAAIHFNTSRDWEKERFRILNTYRTAVSPNVILRNEREQYPSILTLYGLSRSDKNSVLYGRVSWDQSMKRGELFTALMLTRIAHSLHRPGITHTGAVRNVPVALEKAAVNAGGLRLFRQNTETFFGVLDECYGVRSIVYRERIAHTKTNFLVSLAQVFARHANFWDGKELYIDAGLQAKLKSFPIGDPHIGQLAAAGNSAMPILIRMLEDHLNKGVSKNKLRPKMVPADKGDD